jgi:hypothetical protein
MEKHFGLLVGGRVQQALWVGGHISPKGGCIESMTAQGRLLRRGKHVIDRGRVMKDGEVVVETAIVIVVYDE